MRGLIEGKAKWLFGLIIEYQIKHFSLNLFKIKKSSIINAFLFKKEGFFSIILKNANIYIVSLLIFR